MKKAISFKKTTFKVVNSTNRAQQVEHEGYTAGCIGLYKTTSARYWTAYHLPSGELLSIKGPSTREKAYEEAANYISDDASSFDELSDPAENTDNPEPETTAKIIEDIAKKAKEVLCKNCGFKLSSGMFSAYMTSDKTKYSCPECRTKQPTGNLTKTTAGIESTAVVEEPQPEPQPTMPMFDGVMVQAFRFGKKLQRIKLTFTGDTKPHKEDIKKLGKAWWNGALSRWEVDVTDTPLAAKISFVTPQAA